MPVKIKDSKSWFKERVSRFKPVIFLKKNLPLFIFLLLLVLSLVFGLWDIKKYDVYDSKGEEVEEKVEKLIGEYLDKNVVGKNFFSIYSRDVENELIKNISYVKSSRVNKIAPNKLEIFVDIYAEKSVVLDLDNHCKVLSSTGIVLDKLCTEVEDVLLCCLGHTSDGRYYFFKSDEAETSRLTDGKEQLLVMNSISPLVKIIESFGFTIKEILLEEKIVHIKDMDGRIHVFTLSDDLNVQLARYFVVMGKVKGDSMQFSSIDVRFERPVLKD